MVKKLIDGTVKVFSLPGNKFLPGLLLLMMLSHLPYMKLPAVGNHVWRQCNTLAVAKNYAEESMDILKPRVDKRFNKSGITGPQFPAYDYTLAAMYKAFGFSEYYHRWLSLLFFALSVVGLHKLMLQYVNNPVYANVGAAFLAFSPEMYYHGINAVPDIMALACMVWGWYWANKWLKGERWNTLYIASLLLALAGMIKLQFLMAGLPIAWEFLGRKGKPLKAWLQASFLAVISVGLSLWWYGYAAYLVKTYGLHEFVHAMRHAANLGEGLSIFGRNLFSDIPETWVGYAFLPFLLAGVYGSIQLRKTYKSVFVYAVGSLLFYVLVQYQFIHHGYYAIVFLPLLAFFVARGFGILQNSKVSPLLLLIWFSPLWAWLRIAQTNWNPRSYRVPQEFVSPDLLKQLRAGNDTSQRWIVGPDKSGCVYFYYTGVKGYPWDTAAETASMIKAYLDSGAVGFVTDKPELIGSKYTGKLHCREVKSVGRFRWYRVEKQP